MGISGLLISSFKSHSSMFGHKRVLRIEHTFATWRL
jgi:hypothetical protein